MGKNDPSAEQAVQAIYTYAVKLAASGMSPPDIEESLVKKGLDAGSARVVVEKVMEIKRNAMRQTAEKNMLYGGLWCVGGILVTAATFSAASGGGSYVVAWGAIIFGAIQFLRGVSQRDSG